MKVSQRYKDTRELMGWQQISGRLRRPLNSMAKVH